MTRQRTIDRASWVMAALGITFILASGPFASPARCMKADSHEVWGGVECYVESDFGFFCDSIEGMCAQQQCTIDPEGVDMYCHTPFPIWGPGIAHTDTCFDLGYLSVDGRRDCAFIDVICQKKFHCFQSLCTEPLPDGTAVCIRHTEELIKKNEYFPNGPRCLEP